MLSMDVLKQLEGLLKTQKHLSPERSEILTYWYLAKPRAVLFTGCGAGYAVAMSLAHAGGMALDLPVYAIEAGDLWLNHDQYRLLTQDALIVGISGSGDDLEVLRAVEIIKRDVPDAHVLSICAATPTPLEALADYSVALPWADTRDAFDTASVINLYAAGLLTIAMLGDKPHVYDEVKWIAENAESFLERAGTASSHLAPYSAVYILGDGPIFGLSHACASSFMEIADIRATGYHLLSIRHGPMQLFNKETLVVCSLNARDNFHEGELLKEIEGRGAQLIAYSHIPQSPEFGHPLIDLPISISAPAGGILLVALCQWLAADKAIQK